MINLNIKNKIVKEVVEWVILIIIAMIVIDYVRGGDKHCTCPAEAPSDYIRAGFETYTKSAENCLTCIEYETEDKTSKFEHIQQIYL